MNTMPSSGISRLLLFAVALPCFSQAPIRGFPSSSLRVEHQLENRARAIPEPQRIGSYVQRISAKPHIAGSAGSKAVADYVLGLMKEWGLDARIETFEGLLPYPTTRLLEMTGPVRFRAKLDEPGIELDKNPEADELPTFNAYSASGDVTAKLVYVNYGFPEDYEFLRKQGVDVRGKMVIARYGKGWRGAKVQAAQDNGAVACLLYSDPGEDGYFRGIVYPGGPMRPEQGVQRGSVLDMAIYPGDPLSPGWAAEPGSKRLLRSESKALPKIPVMPISSADAQPLMERLGGLAVPAKWQGALPITYRSGPGTADVHLKLDFDWTNKPLRNVIVTIPGSVYKDQWILYGNHHDAWVNGASDPGSAAAVLLETARTLATLRKQGWQPKRTVVFTVWDGEEFGLLGSTEWVEKHIAELQKKAAVYINSDATGLGYVDASGSPTLQTFLSQALRDVNDPLTSKSLLTSIERRPGDGNRSEYPLRLLGAGSDYVPFLHHAGIASLNLGFVASEAPGIYHSRYDSYAWYQAFSDREFTYGTALSKLMTTVLIRLADAPVLPFEFRGMAPAIRAYLDDIEKVARQHSGSVDLAGARAAIARLNESALAFDRALPGLMRRVNLVAPEQLIKINGVLAGAEMTLLLNDGLPGRDWYRHQLYAPDLTNGYDASTLPGVRAAVEAGRWEEANLQARRLAQVVHALEAQVAEATRLIKQAGP